MQTVVETPPYLADAERLLTADERAAVVDTIAADPVCGVVIPGSGGIRKLRRWIRRTRQARRGAHNLPVQRRRGPGLFARGIREKREVGFESERAGRAREGGRRHAERLSETQMSKRAFNKIMEGVEQARAYLDGTGDKRQYRVHVPEIVDVKKIRTRLGLSQESFAATYGFAVSAVRDWEQGRRQPERSARILLKVVEKEPEAITRALTR
jgi:putative transcriptional regulator